MCERSMLFQGPMVRAILDGRKTQTRRAVKLPHPWEIEERDDGSSWPWYPDYVTGGEWDGWVPCPFGQPGDRLWVRETWAPHSDYPDANRAVYRADPGSVYDAERWRPSIHMPRWACRLVLEITEVRVERLQEIRDPDALAEGIGPNPDGYGFHVEAGRFYSANPVASFADLWASTGGDWLANPWVWVISFKRLEEVGHG